MNQYSFLEVAEKLGTTKNVIKYRSRFCPSEYLSKDNGIIFVNEDGLRWFKNRLKNQPVRTSKATAATAPDPVTPSGADAVTDQADHERLIRSLEDRIASLENQLAAQVEMNKNMTERFAELTTSLNNLTAISAGLLKEKDEMILKLEADSKKSWFSRVFHREKKAG